MGKLASFKTAKIGLQLKGCAAPTYCVLALNRYLKLTTTLDRAITQSPCYVPLKFKTQCLK